MSPVTLQSRKVSFESVQRPCYLLLFVEERFCAPTRNFPSLGGEVNINCVTIYNHFSPITGSSVGQARGVRGGDSITSSLPAAAPGIAVHHRLWHVV